MKKEKREREREREREGGWENYMSRPKGKELTQKQKKLGMTGFIKDLSSSVIHLFYSLWSKQMLNIDAEEVWKIVWSGCIHVP